MNGKVPTAQGRQGDQRVPWDLEWSTRVLMYINISKDPKGSRGVQKGSEGSTTGLWCPDKL